MYIFFVLAGVGTVGSTFTSASVTPFFSQAGCVGSSVRVKNEG